MLKRMPCTCSGESTYSMAMLARMLWVVRTTNLPAGVCWPEIGWKEETKRRNNKHKEIWRDTYTCGSQPSCGCVPLDCPEMSRLSRGHSVQSLWNCTEMRSGRPDIPAATPKLSLGHLRGIQTTKFLYSGNAEGSRNPAVIKFHGRLGC